MTVAEVSAVGLPAIFVQLTIGNGEQALNAKPIVDAGGALMVPDEELTSAKVVELVKSLLTNPAKLTAMGAAAQGSGHRVADEVLAKMVLEAVRK